MEPDKIIAVVNQITVSKQGQEIVKWKPTVNGEQNAFTVALQGKAVIRSTEDEIKAVLKWAMLKVGLREKNLPAKEEKQVLIDHILTYYGNHTVPEIRLAFDLAVAGKLEDRNQKGEPIDLEVNCFENFSCLYFSKVMNAFRRWAKDNYSQLKKEEPLMIAEDKEVSPIEMLDWINEYKQREEINIELIPLSFYEFLTVTETIVVSKEQKFEAMDKAAKAIKVQLHNEIAECKTTDALREFAVFEQMEKDGFTGKLKERILNRAKRIIVLQYLKPAVG